MVNIPDKLGEVLFRVIAGDRTAVVLGKSTGTKHSTVMEHLGKLETMGLVHSEKKGRERLYSVDWDNVVNVFAENLVEGETGVTEAFLKWNLAYPAGTIANLPMTSGTKVIARKFEDRKYLKGRTRLIADLRRVMLGNRRVREFIRTYVEAYSHLAWTESDRSLNACTLNFVERFALVVNQNPDLLRSLRKKVHTEEMKGFMRFVRYLTEHAYVDLPSQILCIDRMRNFLVTVSSND